MSTTFEVFPKLAEVPSFQTLLDLSGRRLNEFIAEQGITATTVIKVRLLLTRNNKPRQFAPTLPARWSFGDEYAWFQIEGVGGGTDAYYRPFFESEREMWQEELTSCNPTAEKRLLIEQCLTNDHYWSFRRSAGQPIIITIAYGLIAASLAELTEGLIYSGDGAWSYKRFPATAEEFFSWYFRPAEAVERDEHVVYAERCLTSLGEELALCAKEQNTWLTRLFRRS